MSRSEIGLRHKKFPFCLVGEGSVEQDCHRRRNFICSKANNCNKLRESLIGGSACVFLDVVGLMGDGAGALFDFHGWALGRMAAELVVAGSRSAATCGPGCGRCIR